VESSELLSLSLDFSSLILSLVEFSGVQSVCWSPTGLCGGEKSIEYSTHNQLTLGYLKATLDKFHQNKEYFIQVGCQDHLNFPKLHSLLHYSESIQFFEMTDNYDMEMFKRLHIDFAKDGWRATN